MTHPSTCDNALITKSVSSIVNWLFIVYCFLTIAFLVVDVESVCNKPRIRRAWSDLTLQEQLLYIRAVTLAYESGYFDRMSEVHWASLNFLYAHQTSGFFPWHRWFIWKMENYLRALGPEFECISLTYWDWEYHNGDPYTAGHVLNPEYFGSVTNIPGCVTDGFFVEWTPGNDCVRRTWNRNYTMVSQKHMADLITQFPNYGIDAHGYRSKFEAAPHSNVHNWLGGRMGTSFSTYDPIFYLHHSNVDRMYSLWQDCHDHDRIPQENLGFDQYAGNDPDYNGIDTILPYGSKYVPESITPRVIHHIQGNKMIEMEYSYSQHRFPALINQYHKNKPCNWDWFSVSEPNIPITKKMHPLTTSSDKNNNYNGNDPVRFHQNLPEGCNRIDIESNAIQVVEENEVDGKLHDGPTLEFGYDSIYKSEQLVAIRFALDIEQYANIFSSKVLFTVLDTTYSPVFMKIQVEDTDNSVSFYNREVSGRPVMKKIDWTLSTDTRWTQGSVSTVDITDLIQSVVRRPHWSAGNTITLIFRGVQSNVPNFRSVLSDTRSILLKVSYCK